MRTFLLKCQQGEVFGDFFAKKDMEVDGAVEAIFLNHFAEAFAQNQEDPHSIDK